MPRSSRVQKRRQKLPVSKRVKEYFYIIIALQSASDEIRRAAIRHAPKQLLLAITEIAKNLALDNVVLKREEFLRLKEHAETITELIGAKTSDKRKKEIVQDGGFLAALAGPLISTLAPVLGSVVSSIFTPRRQQRQW